MAQITFETREQCLTEYDRLVEDIQRKAANLVEAANGGKGDERGSKTLSLQARKHSADLARTLKDFRAVSLANDKMKPVNKHQQTTAEAA